MLRSEEWLRNQIGYVVGEKSNPSGERLGLSKNPPSVNQESGQPKPESRASESATPSLKAGQSVSPQTENFQPKKATDPDLWNFGIGHSPLVPLSPLRPIFTEILLTSLAVEEEGAELVEMTVQMDLPELGLTGEAILTDIRLAPAIEPPVDHLDTRQVVTATFHHSSGDVIDLVLADSRSTLPGLPGRTFAAGEPQCRAVVPTAQLRNQGVNDWDNRSTEVAASREVHSGRADQQEAASDSPLSAFGSPLSPACEVGASNHEPAESEETIGTTSNHPFWSVDRQEFVQAGSLEIGERLQTLSGDVKVVQQKLPRPGPQPVFNLEVHYEHVYFVGQDGVLVHNSGPRYNTNKSIALGLSGNEGEKLANFAGGVRGVPWWNWKKQRLTDMDPRRLDVFPDTLTQAATNAKHIHFNLDGFSLRRALSGSADWAMENVTAMEFRTLLGRDDFLAKTTFHLRGTKMGGNEFLDVLRKQHLVK